MIDELVAPNVSFHYPLFETHSAEVLKQQASFIHAVFPDVSVTIEEEIAEGDRVVMRWTQRGTYRGEWEAGIPPTGKSVTWTGISIYRIVGGKIVEERGEEDSQGLLQQVGVLQRRWPAEPFTATVDDGSRGDKSQV